MARAPGAVQTVEGVPGREVAERFFEPQLKALGLGVEQINAQSLEELKDSLSRVNEAIANSEAYGTVNIKLTTNAAVIVAKSQADAHFTWGILPLLLERKRLILSRMRELGGEAAIEALERISDTPSTDTEELRNAIKEVRDQLEVTLSAGRQQTELDQDIARAQHRVEIARARAEIWQSFLARESMASIAGGVLLLLLGIAIIVAMFVGVTVTGVLSNAFLLILGYFFGQSVVRERGGRADTKE